MNSFFCDFRLTHLQGKVYRLWSFDQLVSDLRPKLIGWESVLKAHEWFRSVRSALKTLKARTSQREANL